MQAFADPCTLGNFICLARTSLVNTYDRLTSLSAPSLNELRLRSNDVRSVTAAPYAYINEVDAIQEVLFVLGGSAGQLFQRLSDDNILPRNAVPNPSIDAKDRSMFKVHPQACLKHMSVLAFISILESFCKYANSINQLRILKKVVIDSPPTRFGQTAQAFASSLDEPLSLFERKLSRLERICRDQEHKGSTPSLLSLYDELGSDLEMFSYIHDMYQEIDGLENALYEYIEDREEREDHTTNQPLTITISLLNTLYHHVDVAQSSNSSWCSELERIFLISFQPYARMIDSWISDGSLSQDVGSELFVERNPQINVKSSRFWRHGYQLRNADHGSPYPVFLHSFISKIFFSGKAVNFIFGMDIPKVSNLVYTHHLFLDAYLCEEFDKRQLKRQEKITRHEISPTERLLQSHFPTLSDSKLDQPPQSPTASAITSDAHMQDLFRHWYSSLLDGFIDPRYQHLAKTLMKTLNEQANLKHHLQSLACLFLMIEGDVMQRFADSIFIRMEEGKSWYDNRTINALFLEACRGDNGICHENVHIETKLMKTAMKQITATAYSKTWSDQSLSVLETIIIHYQLPKPVSNFIRRSTLQEYRKINTFILQIKRANRIMEQLLVYKGRFQTNNNDIEAMAKFYSLRLRLMWFVKTIHSYILTTILHSETVLFQRQLANLVNVDDIVLLHDDYVRKIVDRCLLNDKGSTAAIRLAVINILNKTIVLSRLFKKFVQDPATKNFNQASMFMMLPPRIDSDEEESDSEIADDGCQKDDNESKEDRYFVSFEQGLSLLSEEYNESLRFLTMTLSGLARHGGLTCFEMLAQSLSV
ncbi:Gamma-tubulin complex component 5 [Umbelopsis sp. WA50703]